MKDWIYFASPINGVIQFGKREKLTPRYVGPYKILKRIGKAAYELEFPSELTMVHSIFYMLMLSRKFVGDANSVMPLEILNIEENLSYEELLIEILVDK